MGLANASNTTAAILAAQLNELAVTTGGTTSVSIASGWALVNGAFYTNDAAITSNIPTPSGATRLDRIVLRFTASTTQTVRVTRLANTEGVGTDVALTQNATTWDIPLARATITTGGAITVIDQRVWVKGPTVRGALDNVTLDWNTTTKTAQLKAGGIATAHLGTDLSITGSWTSTKNGGGPGGGFIIASAGPAYSWNRTAAAVDARIWDMSAYSNGSVETFNLRAVNDANSLATTALSFVRSAGSYGITSVLFPAGNVAITNNATIGGTLGVTGTLAAGATTITGAASVSTSLTVTGEIHRVPKALWRQGGSATDWSSPGTTNYQPDNIRAYPGAINISMVSNTGTQAITFPITFTNPPVMAGSCISNTGQVVTFSGLTASGCTVTCYSASGITGFTATITYFAIGPI